MLKIPVEEIKHKLAKVLLKHGVEASDAYITATVLVEGDIRGYQSHGINRIFQILEGFEKGSLSAKNTSHIINDFKTITLIDGDGYLGQPLASQAMLMAVKKSKKYGIGLSGVINSGHIGILSYYSELALKHNCLALVLSTSSPAVALKGSGQKTFGTNPISFAVPSEKKTPILADFASSKVCRGKIYQYLNDKREIPLDWAVDEMGNQTADPEVALKGGLTTLDADIKGASISLLVSILAGPLIGGVINPFVRGTRYMDDRPNKGDFFLSFDLEAFGDVDRFKKSIDSLINFIESQECEYRIPGTNTQKNKKENLKCGIEVPSEIMDLFNKYSDTGFSNAA